MTRFLKKLHQNDKGATAWLVLLTIWCLMSLFAMTWNTAEYSYRRQHVQTSPGRQTNADGTGWPN